MKLLTSTLLRRIGAPLRAANPRLYAKLNRVRAQLLTRGRPISAYQGVAIDRFDRRVRVRGRRILEIGTDPAQRMLGLLSDMGAARAIGVNNDPTFRSGHSGARTDLTVVIADAARLPFADASFDAIFSVATFEHILDLPRALDEMHRVLVKGGVLYTNFGPIWTGGKGHHLRVKVGDEEARHFIPEKNPLPDHCHLLLTPAELRASLAGRVSPALLEPIVHWVYEDPGINRLFHHEYIEILNKSRFTIESIVPERDPVPPQLRRILELKYPAEKAFDVTNMEVIAVK